ncbi:MAG: helicase-related protein, partial [Fusobacteriaceae bacterium]
IVFTNGKHKAKYLSRILEGRGMKSVSFQGNLSQNQRDAALSGFRSGAYNILVATDIAARGLDIPQVTHVINYDLPKTPEAFTHRSGRTGRANKSGIVISFSAPEDKKLLSDIIKTNSTEFNKVHGEESNAPVKKAKESFFKNKTKKEFDSNKSKPQSNRTYSGRNKSTRPQSNRSSEK